MSLSRDGGTGTKVGADGEDGKDGRLLLSGDDWIEDCMVDSGDGEVRGTCLERGGEGGSRGGEKGRGVEEGWAAGTAGAGKEGEAVATVFLLAIVGP